jgi:hypothetical protein
VIPCLENYVQGFLFVLQQLNTLLRSLSASLSKEEVRNMQTWHIRSGEVIYQHKSTRKLSDIYQNKQQPARARQNGRN